MVFGSLFNKHESLVCVDIGASSIKLLEMDTTGAEPLITNIAMAPLADGVFASNILNKTEVAAEEITKLLSSHGIADKRIITAMPAPSVFTKRVKMPKLDYSELASNIEFEASNFIPHNIDAVRLDFHVIGETGKNQLDVLVVAVKNEIIDSYMDCFGLAGLDVAVVDVDYFAIQNMFELVCPEKINSTTALINIGSRYSAVNICRAGESLFTGDISAGGKVFTEAISLELGITSNEAEDLKKQKLGTDEDSESLKDILDEKIQHVAAEYNRQLSFFWNASGAEGGIDEILLTGGSAVIPGLKEELSERTGINCSLLEPLHGLKTIDGIDETYIKEVEPYMAIAVGLGIRQPGDKIIPEWE